MVPLLHVHALVVALEIRLAHKLLVAVCHLAGEGILPLLVVRLHVRFEVVAAAEHLAAPLDLADKVGLLLGRQPAGRPSWPLDPELSLGVVHEARGLWPAGRPRVELVWLYWVVVGLVPGGRGSAVGKIAG